MMECKDAILLMKAYMEGELPAQLVFAFNKHVWGQLPNPTEDPADEGCEDCKRCFISRFSEYELSCTAIQAMMGAYLNGRIPRKIANIIEVHLWGHDIQYSHDRNCESCNKFLEEHHPIPPPPKSDITTEDGKWNRKTLEELVASGNREAAKILMELDAQEDTVK